MADILKSKLDYYPENFNTLPAVSPEVATSLLCSNPDFDTNTCIELFEEKNKDIYIKCQENIKGGVVLVNSKFEIDGRFKKIFQKKGKESSGINSDINSSICNDSGIELV